MNIVQTQAMQAYQERNFEQAIPLLEAELVASLDVTMREELLFRLGVAYDALGRHADALSALKNLLELNSDSARAWNNVGIICMKLDRLEEARSAFEKAYRLDPGSVAPLISLGSLCLKCNDPGHALEYLHAGLLLEPGNPMVHANLALTYAVFGRLEEAEDNVRLAVLYGFNNAEPIQSRIEALKEIREARRQQGQTVNGSEHVEDDVSDTAGRALEDIEMLARLEQEMYSMVERLNENGVEDSDTTEAMAQLRQVIRVVRRGLGLPEVLESDVYNGVNYMQDEARGSGE